MAAGRVVVTGGSGRVGRHVLAALAPRHDVVNFDRAPPDPARGDPAGIRYRQGDVMRLDEVRAAVAGADAVVHLAAIDFDWKAAPEEFIRVNTLGSWHVLQAAAEAGVKRVVLCSSIAADGLNEARSDWAPQYLQVDEAHERRPVQAYGVSKSIIETMGKSFADGGMSVICLRPMAVVLEETLAEFIAFVDAPGRRWLMYYVTGEDVGRGFAAAVDVEGVRYGVYFLAAADSTRPEPTLDWYPRVIGSLPEIRNPRLFKVQPRASVFSHARARDHLGWEPTSDFDALRRKANSG